MINLKAFVYKNDYNTYFSISQIFIPRMFAPSISPHFHMLRAGVKTKRR